MQNTNKDRGVTIADVLYPLLWEQAAREANSERRNHTLIMWADGRNGNGKPYVQGVITYPEIKPLECPERFRHLMTNKQVLLSLYNVARDTAHPRLSRVQLIRALSGCGLGEAVQLSDWLCEVMQ